MSPPFIMASRDQCLDRRPGGAITHIDKALGLHIPHRSNISVDNYIFDFHIGLPVQKLSNCASRGCREPTSTEGLRDEN